MGCRKTYTRDTLVSLLPMKFINGDLKRHREKLLFEREQAMMPSTQPYVNREIQRRKNVEALQQLQTERWNMKRKLRQLEMDIHHLQYNIVPPVENDNKRQFVHRCGLDGCRGFLSTAWKCGVCSNYTCSDCGVLKGMDRDAAHTCKESDKATMQLIKSDSRRCPGCAQYIYKVSGCDQMWCTGCFTAFSWRTGMKINGSHIHNPHYYEFQRRGGTLGRELGDIPCGGRPTFRELSVAITPTTLQSRLGSAVTSHNAFASKSTRVDPNRTERVMTFHRLVNHIDAVERPRHPTETHHDSNVDARILYILGEMTRQDLESKLQQREKARDKKKEIGMILSMYVDTMSDLFRQCVLAKSTSNFLESMESLTKYENTQLASISKQYNCVVPFSDAQTGSIRYVKHNHTSVKDFVD